MPDKRVSDFGDSQNPVVRGERLQSNRRLIRPVRRSTFEPVDKKIIEFRIIVICGLILVGLVPPAVFTSLAVQ